jgi:hypothetical protein
VGRLLPAKQAPVVYKVMMLAEVQNASALSEVAHLCKQDEGVYDCDNDYGWLCEGSFMGVSLWSPLRTPNSIPSQARFNPDEPKL